MDNMEVMNDIDDKKYKEIEQKFPVETLIKILKRVAEKFIGKEQNIITDDILNESEIKNKINNDTIDIREHSIADEYIMINYYFQ